MFLNELAEVPRPIWILAACFGSSLSASTLQTVVGPLAMREIGASTTYATASIGVMLAGIAFASPLSGYAFEAFGRRNVFLFGIAIGAAGGALGAVACQEGWINSLFISGFLIGMSQGLGQFYRFAAVEFSRDKSMALTITLSGGVIAAFAGPMLALATSSLLPRKFVASYLVVIAINLVGVCLLLTIDWDICAQLASSVEDAAVATSSAGESSDLLLAPSVVVAPVADGRGSTALPVLIATISYATMIVMMSPLTLAMVDVGIPQSVAILTLEAHFLAMFIPGFWTSLLIKRFGTHSVALAGALFFGTMGIPAFMGRSITCFMASLVIVGAAWNCEFSAGSVMLAELRLRNETHVQAYNDFIIFSLAGVSSVSSGYIYSTHGWAAVIWTAECLNMAFVLFLAIDLLRCHYSDKQSKESANSN